MKEEEKLFTESEVILHSRNHGCPIETIKHNLTPSGLHYTLIHYDIPYFEDVENYKIEVKGEVEKSITFNLKDLMNNYPRKKLVVTLECAGSGRGFLKEKRPYSQPWFENSIGTSEFEGVPLKLILEKCGVKKSAVDIIFTGHDSGVEEKDNQNKGVQNYQRSLSPQNCMDEDVLLAFKMNGSDLLPQHGYPIRLVVPSWYGMTSVKWLKSIEVVTKKFDSYQMRAYTYKTDNNGKVAITKIKVRSLFIPPGVPSFYKRERFVEPHKDYQVFGRAWAGDLKIKKVEYSLDGGSTWKEANIQENKLGKYAWTAFTFNVNFGGEGNKFVVCTRATDEKGNTQPVDPNETFNYGGFGINSVQKVVCNVMRGVLL